MANPRQRRRRLSVCACMGCAAHEGSCPQLTRDSRCEQCGGGAWANSRTAGQRVRGRTRQRRNARIMREHRGSCHVCGQPGADEVDHVVPLAEGGTDDETNLRPIHAEPCHAAKTADEARRNRAKGGG